MRKTPILVAAPICLDGQPAEGQSVETRVRQLERCVQALEALLTPDPGPGRRVTTIRPSSPTGSRIT